ncbi:MAG: hypothetical protein M3N47_06845 [Chloroflexota bacterium]|nr:hypothetical protein [Chloroflexota bacterium]
MRTEGFAQLLAGVVANAVALHRIASGVLDLVVRNLRLAGREDLTRLGRQVGRAEDKLERVLQEVETLQPPVKPQVEPPARSPTTLRASLGGAALTALPVAATLLAIHPPALAGLEEGLALSVGALGLILLSAWLTLSFACRPQGRSK